MRVCDWHATCHGSHGRRREVATAMTHVPMTSDLLRRRSPSQEHDVVAHTDPGIRAGLDHERVRLTRIAAGELPLRRDLSGRRSEVVDALKRAHARAERLLVRLATAEEEEAERIASLALRAWRSLRTQILYAVEERPHPRHPRVPRTVPTRRPRRLG
jgi:hypothetical protein